jgi:predicted dehydrogenase
MTRTRVAVIGVGHLGQHHARLLAAIPEVELVAVVDTKPGRAGEIGAKHGVAALTDAAGLVGRVDAVTIATPTASHVDVALAFVEAGAAVLVEKPIAVSLAEADRLVNLREISDFDGFQLAFNQLFGFDVEGVDYDQPVETETAIVNPG